MSCFEKEENRVKACQVLIQRVKEKMEEVTAPVPEPAVTASTSSSREEEPWEKVAKRRKKE